MSEENPQPGTADWLRPGGAQGEQRPETTGDEVTGEELDASQDVHGTEGGGDPAAGAQQDATAHPDGGHRSGREI
ncbi:hypothetical protein [Georgenia deserti]|uniref:Uncharacterized protein n=1 Tax=Georgenia deserti TaxID=2093781 RepID=A0ABW4L507_9MICO